QGAGDGAHGEIEDFPGKALAAHVAVDARLPVGIQPLLHEAAVEEPGERREGGEEDEPRHEDLQAPEFASFLRERHLRFTSFTTGRAARRLSHMTPNRSTIPTQRRSSTP